MDPLELPFGKHKTLASANLRKPIDLVNRQHRFQTCLQAF